MKKTGISLLLILAFVINGKAQQWTTSGTNIYNSNTGNVGIGTPSPADQLEIVSGNRKVGFNTAISGVSPGGILSLSRPDDGLKIMYLGGAAGPTDDHVIFGQGGGTEMRLVSAGSVSSGFGFYTNISMAQAFGSTRPTPVMKIDGSGKVGIGTSTPGNLLTVQGNGALGSTFQQKITMGSQTLALGANPNAAEVQSQGAVPLYLNYGGNNVIMNATGGNVGIGTSNPQAKLDVYSSGLLGSTKGNFLLLNRFSSSAGTANIFMNNSWLVRGGAGSDWLTARLHNGISIDGSYLTPGIDTKTWWERDPFNNIQSWGDQSTTYMTINSGNVGIGTTSPDAKLAVKGLIHAQEVKIDLQGSCAPDYVFEQDYKLTSLEEIKAYINQNKHLPEVPSATEMEKNGVQLGEMNMILLKKVEELTLHLIQTNERMDKLEKENAELKKRTK